MTYDVKAKGTSTVLDDGTTVVHSAAIPAGEVWGLFVAATSPQAGPVYVLASNPHVIEGAVGYVGYYSYLRPDGMTDFAVTNTLPDRVDVDWKILSL